MSSTILVVEADEATAQFLCDQLTADGYSPAVVSTIAGARELADEQPTELLLLGDPAEPRGALDLMAEVRAGRRPFDPRLPMLALTCRADELDVVRAFRYGADDVVARPFSYPELRARIAALLRRAEIRAPGELIHVDALQIDTRARRVRLHGVPVALTQREYALLLHLASEPERVFTKDELLRQVWGYRSMGATRTLDSHACRLRDKLRRDHDRARVINVWGVGYALRHASMGRVA